MCSIRQGNGGRGWGLDTTRDHSPPVNDRAAINQTQMPIRKKQHRSIGEFSDLLGNAREVLGSPMLDRNMYSEAIERANQVEEERGAYSPPSAAYAELHCHSNYSFQEGASDTQELLKRARELG